MPKAKFYAVKKGFRPGIYPTWNECAANTKGFKGVTYKKFNSLRDAEHYMDIIPIDKSYMIATQTTTITNISEGPSQYRPPLLVRPSTLPARPSTLPARPSSSKPYDRPTRPIRRHGKESSDLRRRNRRARRDRIKLDEGEKVVKVEGEKGSGKVRTKAEKGIRKEKIVRMGKDGKPKPVEYAVPDEAGWLIAYTDGACQGNGKDDAKAGIGVWYGPNDPRNLSERCPGDQTNNRAELIAIIRCIETEQDPSVPLIIKTDSQYAIKCIRDWLPNWIARGWKGTNGEPIKNKRVIQHLTNILDDRPGKVVLQYVKGHAGIEGNEGADKLAGAGKFEPPINERRWPTLRKKSAEAAISSPHAASPILIPEVVSIEASRTLLYPPNVDETSGAFHLRLNAELETRSPVN
ncbi:hypothetical protein FRB97_009670 [Tulasnella sp. 331]|nr:hypothetical protein FRB98_005686 [Tulasnella sp. 332]KAG8881328.1 hypothetical protein FRB97_009670 [Tulasnella sp. 331]